MIRFNTCTNNLFFFNSEFLSTIILNIFTGASSFPDLIHVLIKKKNLNSEFLSTIILNIFIFLVNDQQGKINRSLLKLIKYNLI